MLSLDKIVQRCGLSLKSDALEKLASFYDLLRQEGQRTNLVGPEKSFEDFVVKHFIDCLWVGEKFELSQPLMDLGTGAGLPGIVLKILNPDFSKA